MISVIVATHNRRALLQRTLDALARQDWPHDRLEVVVVDNDSTDGTADFLQSLAARSNHLELVLRHESRPGKSYAVNTGIVAARGDVLAFTDDDVIPDRCWLSALTRAIRETGADFGTGRITPLWEVPPPAWLTPALYGVLAIPDNGSRRLLLGPGLNEDVMPIGANLVVRRHVLSTIGGWRTDLGKLRQTLRSGEDHEFFLRMMRAGYRGVYEPTARVAHLVPASRLQRGYFRRWLYDNGRMVAGLDRLFPSAPRHLLGVPRFRWREAAASAWRLAAATWQGDEAERFARETQLLWFAGYLRGAWFARPDAGVSMAPGHATESVLIEQ